MDKELTIKVTDKVDIFKVYLAAINWTLGANSLTESEIEIFSILLYYNDIYKEIKDNQVRSDLILSNVVKKKIKEEFGVSASKLETYLGKLRKKGLITDCINSKYMIYPDKIITLKYNFLLSTRDIVHPVVNNEEVIIPQPFEPIQEEVTPEIPNTWTEDWDY